MIPGQGDFHITKELRQLQRLDKLALAPGFALIEVHPYAQGSIDRDDPALGRPLHPECILRREVNGGSDRRWKCRERNAVLVQEHTLLWQEQGHESPLGRAEAGRRSRGPDATPDQLVSLSRRGSDTNGYL